MKYYSFLGNAVKDMHKKYKNLFPERIELTGENLTVHSENGKKYKGKFLNNKTIHLHGHKMNVYIVGDLSNYL
jgi:hypothetical protein